MSEPLVGRDIKECDHQFTFLRQERINEGYERNPIWVYYDVFYCARCVNYQRVKVKETVPSRDSFTEETVWSKNR
jgi:hypothetical protein